ncbi:MAG: hypothetical protein ACKOVA_05220 [Novosphingobium sp.]
MHAQSNNLKNYARGSGKFHFHRLNIIRDILDAHDQELPEPLSDFLRTKLFTIPEGWTVFGFQPKDWKLCERLLACESRQVEERLLDLVLDYVSANMETTQRLYGLSNTISNRLLREKGEILKPESDILTAIDAQSLFGLRLECASNQSSTETMIERLRASLKGWPQARLVHPMVYHFSATPHAAALDSFLSYIVTGKEHDAEKLAMKLILSDEAARNTSLAFKTYVGLMGHPYDAIEFILDHVEYTISAGIPLPDHLVVFVRLIGAAFPLSRANAMLPLVGQGFTYSASRSSATLAARFDLSTVELERYIALCDVADLDVPYDPHTDRPLAILTNMRVTEYPDPLQFQIITTQRAVWHFIDAGRLLGALLRSIYMIEREARDLEARDALRLLYFLGYVSPFLVSVPSAMSMLRGLDHQSLLQQPADQIEVDTDAVLAAASPLTDRLWINELQWKLRRLEEQGRVRDWLQLVRSQTRLRPSYLTGINWHWVEEVISLQRLKPFRSFDGAYLFIHMELEAATSDPLRLRLTLEPLIRDLSFSAMVNKLIEEFGVSSQSIVRRYLSTHNLLASGMAPNYMAALDQRVRALEACIKQFDFGPLLSEDDYESEVKALTAELLLTNVNAGKFEVPWDIFRKDVNDSHQDLYRAVESLRPRLEEEGQLTAIIDIPITFPNGRVQTFRVRARDQPIFALLAALISGFMQHSAFGLEVILSGRFRHNNLMQELWNAMAEVGAATIPSVTLQTRTKLGEEYKLATEQVIDDWCGTHLQTKRSEKQLALFDLVPSQKEVDALVVATWEANGMLAIIDVVIDWIKSRLREQVALAKVAFEEQVPPRVTSRFEKIQSHQIAAGSYREADVKKVHAAISGAMLRKLEDLGSWFDGVDTVTTGPIRLDQLSLATQALFENMFPERTLTVTLDDAAEGVLFDPGQVKIAFDMLREIYFNAIRYGEGPEVELMVIAQDGTGGAFSFRNAASWCCADEQGRREVAGHVYLGRNEALAREGNSGLPKIAASSATLIGHDTTIKCVRDEQSYEVIVPLARREAEAA